MGNMSQAFWARQYIVDFGGNKQNYGSSNVCSLGLLSQTKDGIVDNSMSSL